MSDFIAPDESTIAKWHDSLFADDVWRTLTEAEIEALIRDEHFIDGHTFHRGVGFLVTDGKHLAYFKRPTDFNVPAYEKAISKGGNLLGARVAPVLLTGQNHPFGLGSISLFLTPKPWACDLDYNAVGIMEMMQVNAAMIYLYDVFNTEPAGHVVRTKGKLDPYQIDFGYAFLFDFDPQDPFLIYLSKGGSDYMPGYIRYPHSDGILTQGTITELLIPWTRALVERSSVTLEQLDQTLANIPNEYFTDYTDDRTRLPPILEGDSTYKDRARRLLSQRWHALMNYRP